MKRPSNVNDGATLASTFVIKRWAAHRVLKLPGYCRWCQVSNEAETAIDNDVPPRCRQGLFHGAITCGALSSMIARMAFASVLVVMVSNYASSSCVGSVFVCLFVLGSDNGYVSDCLQPVCFWLSFYASALYLLLPFVLICLSSFMTRSMLLLFCWLFWLLDSIRVCLLHRFWICC